MPFLLLLPLFLFAACSGSSFSYQSAGEYFGGSPLGPGTYLQESLLEPKAAEAIRLNVIFQRKPGSTLSNAMLAGKPVFQVLDRYQGEAKLRFYPAAPAGKEALLREFYEGMRPLLVLDDKPSQPQPLVKERYPDQRPRRLAMPGAKTELVIDSYDWNGHANKLTIHAPEWSAKLSLREYSTEN